MDEKVKYYEKRLGFGTFWTDSHIKDLLSHISTLEARLDSEMKWAKECFDKWEAAEKKVKERGDKINDYEHQLIEAGMEVSCLRNRVRELEAERR